MLLIGIIGPVGSGKTALLSTLAEWWRGTGKEADGFIAQAGERAPGVGGASRYDIVMLKTGKVYPYALRDESLKPPYRFEEDTSAMLSQWADSLPKADSPTLLIIDEFGPIEATGGGHIRLWHQIRSSKPQIVVVAVRKGLEGAIQSQLGCKFDLLVDVDSRDAREKLRLACAAHSDWTRIGLYGGGAGGFEASVGAVLHGSQVPLRGLFMSSMQSVIMTYAAQGLGHRRRVVWVSFLAASLKALSPTGNRLRPMMAITFQGILYTIAITLLGWNILGVMLGGFLVGAWSALQGVALQYLFIGSELIQAYDAIIQWIAKLAHIQAVGFVALVFGWTILCGLVSSVLTLLAWNRRHLMPGRLRDVMLRKPAGITLAGKPAGLTEAVKRGLKDIARPLFWLPVVIVVLVMVASGSPVESIVWVVIRAAGIGFVVLSLARAFDFGRFIRWLENRGHWGPALAYKSAIDRLGTHDPPSSGSKEV
jgi:nucleoside-triphosphatase THEP1